MHPAALPESELLTQCELGRSRSSGPGGQHRNKVETKVTLTHRLTGIQAQASERRSVRENRPVAVRRLRLALAVEHREGVPDGDARSELWRSRCVGSRIVCNPRHDDYPALLAEALDMVAACGSDLRKAATRLDCTPTQLVRFIADHPPAFERLNRERAARGERPLRL